MIAINRIVDRNKGGRRAFTLVELMVVVAIMAVLAALVAGVVIKATEAQRNSNTLTTMEVIKSSLSKQLQAVIDDGKDKERKGIGAITSVVQAAFPKNIASVTAANYIKYKSNPNTLYDSSWTGKQEEFAYLLRMILEAGPFSKLDTDLLPKGSIATDKPFMVDAWGDLIRIEITNPKPTTIKFSLKSNNVSETVSN